MIELENLQKVIDRNLIIDIEALTVKAGEIVALVGPMGCGKAQLFELLIGKSRPTVGTLRLAGVVPSDRHPFSRQVGVLFSEDDLYKRQSPRVNLVFHCWLRGLHKARVTEVLAQVGLADHANAKLDKLPPGLARRLAFGRAILHGPKVLLLAEPFARCDEATVALLSRLIRQGELDFYRPIDAGVPGHNGVEPAWVPEDDYALGTICSPGSSFPDLVLRGCATGPGLA